jgi:hypothetical protein
MLPVPVLPFLSNFKKGKILLLLVVLAVLGANSFGAYNVTKKEDLWSLKPLTRPELPKISNGSANPVDLFLGDEHAAKSIVPLGPADKLTWLRRVAFDLTGLPPTLEEQDTFLSEESPRALDKVVDRLLASEQHGVRYGRHWLDVLRYTDVDENMPASSSIYLWRDWVITAINNDLPYDDFARAQICGNRARARTKIGATGHRNPVEPRPDDVFALGFLSRGATSRANNDQALAISAVETISSAFLGMTVGCAKCHDHFFDPILQKDYYSMKALFDPLVLEPVDLVTAEERFAHGRALDEYERKLWEVEDPISRLTEPYRAKLYEERVSMLPPDVQPVIRKPEKERTAAEQKIADDYFPILRLDPPKIREIMPPDVAKEYDALMKRFNALKRPDPLPVFYTVQEDAKRATEKSYVLNTGDPTKPKLDKEVQPGFPFASDKIEFREGRRETFVDWLTAPENPLFARVAVSRIWQWHFGEGLHASASDFGTLGGQPLHPKLLDYLASEFIAHDYSMKWLHRLIVTSDTYRRASSQLPITNSQSSFTNSFTQNQQIDPDNHLLWRFPVQRLEAEPIRDAMLFVSGDLDSSLGGKSFDASSNTNSHRRTAYMQRGFRSYAEVMPDFLTTFDVDDGRAVCPRRTQTVTAPQALFLMNNQAVEEISTTYAKRLRDLAVKDPKADLITLAFRTALGRPPSANEIAKSRTYLEGMTVHAVSSSVVEPGVELYNPERIKGLAWLLLNLDEFIYLR